MDRETYENAETARMINEHFVAGEGGPGRAAGCGYAVSGGGGGDQRAGRLAADGVSYSGGQAVLWRDVFSAGGSHGRPGFQRVLLTMAEAFQKRREEVESRPAA